MDTTDHHSQQQPTRKRRAGIFLPNFGAGSGREAFQPQFKHLSSHSFAHNIYCILQEIRLLVWNRYDQSAPKLLVD